MRTPQANTSQASAFFLLALVGHLLLLATITGWYLWIDPPQDIPRILPVIILGTPLLFFLRPLLRGSAKAYQVSSLVALLYLAIGIVGSADGEIWYGVLLSFASLLWGAGSLLSLRVASHS